MVEVWFYIDLASPTKLLSPVITVVPPSLHIKN